MASITDLDNALTQLEADVSALVTATANNSQAVQALLTKLAAAVPASIDLSKEVTAVQTADQTLKNMISTIVSSDTAAGS